jgi:hypothetical protein
MDESPEYLKGKIAGLERLSLVLINALADQAKPPLPGQRDLRTTLADHLPSINAAILTDVRVADNPFGQGICDAITEFSAKLLG